MRAACRRPPAPPRRGVPRAAWSRSDSPERRAVHAEEHRSVSAHRGGGFGVQDQIDAQPLAVGPAGLVGVRAVRQVRAPGHGMHEPGVLAAQPYQPLVEPEHPVPRGGEPGGAVRERRTDLVVAAGPVGLHAAPGVLVAVVDGRDASHGEQDDDGQGRQLVTDPGGDPRDIVVAHEGHGDELVHEPIVSRETPVEFEEIPVEQRAPDGLPQLVLGQRVHFGAADDLPVVAVDHLADEPARGELGADPGQHPGPELRGHSVGGVKPPGRRAAPQPVAHDIRDEVDDGLALMIQRGKAAVTLEVGVCQFAARTIDPEHRLLGPSGQCPAEERMGGPDMVEDAVEHDDDAAPTALCDEPVEGRVVTEPLVDGEEVGRVVAVGLRAEDGPQGEAVGAERDEMVEPWDNPVEPRHEDPLLVRRTDRGAGEAQRVDVPPDAVINPSLHVTLLRLY